MSRAERVYPERLADFARGDLSADDFWWPFHDRLPEYADQSPLDRQLVLLFEEWIDEGSLGVRDAVVTRMREAVLAAGDR